MKFILDKIKLFDPAIGINEEQAIIKVLQSKFWASGSGSRNILKYLKLIQCTITNFHI